MLRGTPVVLSCVCALHTKGARRSCAHKNMPNTRAEVMKKRQFEWPKLSQLCDLGSASMQIRLSPNFVVLLAHGMNSTQNKFGDYAPARSGSLRLSKSTHLVHIWFRLLWALANIGSISTQWAKEIKETRGGGEAGCYCVSRHKVIRYIAVCESFLPTQ